MQVEINPSEYTVLIVDDTIANVLLLKVLIGNQKYRIVTANNGMEALQAVEKESPDLILLDIMMPGMNGYEVAEKLKTDPQTQEIPIIFLTARDTEADMIEGFRAGCDDYIAKPFSMELLYQRIEAVLRRSENVPDGVKRERFHYGDMSVDFERMQVYISDEPVKLSVTEYRILELLIKNKGRVLTRDMIIQKIWDDNENYVDENTLNVHIRRLRQKIEKDAGNPEYVITVFGIGYTFGET